MKNDTLTRDFDETVVTLTSVFGMTSFLVNVTVLTFVIRLLKQLNANNDQYHFIKQISCLSINDTVSSFMLFWLGIIRVTDRRTAILCAFVDYLPLVVQSMSLSNIMCISCFRFCIARNIRRRGAVKHNRFTLIMFIVNCIVGIINLTLFLATLEIPDIPVGSRIACEYISLVSERTRLIIGFMFYACVLVCTITSDIMCLLTILRLRREMHLVVGSSDGTSGSADTGNTTSSSIHPARLNSSQRRAICTVLFILLFLNVSVLPLVSGLFVNRFVRIPDHVLRMLFVFTFVNSMFNPVVIAARFQEVRRVFREVWTKIRTCLMCCFN